jgi:hypothetical protein
MEHIPSREAKSPSASQEIPLLLFNQKVHYRVHKNPATVQIIRPIPRPCVTCNNQMKTTPFQLSLLLTECISSYLPYLEAVSSIRKPRTRHAVVTATQITWARARDYIYLPLQSTAILKWLADSNLETNGSL